MHMIQYALAFIGLQTITLVWMGILMVKMRTYNDNKAKKTEILYWTIVCFVAHIACMFLGLFSCRMQD